MAKLARALTALTLALIALPLLALAVVGGTDWTAVDHSALRFSVEQALCSAAISSLLAIPIARALARRRFPGRGVIISILGAPFLLPVIVAVMGLLSVFGRNGWVSLGLGTFGFAPLRIYGFHGVVLAHVFLNLPLAVRLLLQSWHAVPTERFRLAESLGFGPKDIWRHIERPLLKTTLPATFAAIFAICLTSFAVALTMGGGPRATTLELAIYQALRFDFDLGRAGATAGMQTLLGAGAAWIAWRLAPSESFGRGHSARLAALPAPKGWRRAGDAVAIGLILAFLTLPLAAVIRTGLAGLGELPAQIWPALTRSCLIALASALSTTALALCLALNAAQSPKGGFELVALLPLATSSLALGTGMFLLTRAWVAPADIALFITLLVNTLMALPFAYRILAQPCAKMERDYGRLAQSLGLSGWARLRRLVWPQLSAPIGFAAGVSGALSMGDLGVIALFADSRAPTLPLFIQQLASSYQLAAAAAASLILILASFLIFALFDLWGRHART